MIGTVEAIFRYPIKSLACERLDAADVGWYGVDGDRRYALRRVGALGGMPWLTASSLPELVRFTPRLPGHVRTPEGTELALDELAAEVSLRHGKPVELMQLRHGVFDETPISVITTGTIDAIGVACGRTLDVRSFRPNIVITGDAFEDDAWVGATLAFDGGPAIAVTMRDERCAMLGIDPDTARSDPNVHETVVRERDNYAGVYATVIRCGRIAVGQRVQILA